MTNRMPDSITDGPQPDDEQIIPHPDPDSDYPLNDTLRDIARLSAQTDILDDLYTGLEKDMYRKRQAD